MGVLGALTNNDTGIAGMTWKPYLLPVRALGKCGGFDSDIIIGIEVGCGHVDQRRARIIPIPPGIIVNL